MEIEHIMNHWYIMPAVAAIIIAICAAFFKFIKLPSDKQLEKVRQWLLYICLEAEKELGSGTGILKLRWVYDAFLSRFPWVARFISFSMFSSLVDEALYAMVEILESNPSLAEFVTPQHKGSE